MSDKIILVVSDEAGSRRGEISVLGTPEEAERTVETLLETGFDQARIKVFKGMPSEFATTYRPVVHLMNDVPDEPTGGDRPAVVEREPTRVEADSPVVAGNGNGVRPSSLFRSARDETFRLSACEAAA